MARNPLRFNSAVPSLRPNLRASEAAFAGAGAKEQALAQGAQDMAKAALAVDRYQAKKAADRKRVKMGLAEIELKGAGEVEHERTLNDGQEDGSDYTSMFKTGYDVASQAIAEKHGLSGDEDFIAMSTAIGAAEGQKVLLNQKRAYRSDLVKTEGERILRASTHLTERPSLDYLLSAQATTPGSLEAQELIPGSRMYEKVLGDTQRTLLDAYLQGSKASDILSMRAAREHLDSGLDYLDNEEALARIGQMDHAIQVETNRINRAWTKRRDDYIDSQMKGEPAQPPALLDAQHTLTPDRVAADEEMMARAKLTGAIVNGLPAATWGEKQRFGSLEEYARDTGGNPDDPFVRENHRRITAAIAEDDDRIAKDFAGHALDGVSDQERADYENGLTAIEEIIAGVSGDEPGSVDIVHAAGLDGLNDWEVTLYGTATEPGRVDTHGTTSNEFVPSFLPNDDAERLGSAIDRTFLREGNQATVATMTRLHKGLGDSWGPVRDDIIRQRPELAGLFLVAEYGPGDDSDAMLFAMRDEKGILDDLTKDQIDEVEEKTKAAWNTSYDKRLSEEPAYKGLPDPSDTKRDLSMKLARYLMKHRGLSSGDAVDEAINMVVDKHFVAVGEHAFIERAPGVPAADFQLVNEVLAGRGPLVGSVLGIAAMVPGVGGEGILSTTDSGERSLVTTGGGSLDPKDILRHDAYAVVRDNMSPPDGGWTDESLERAAEALAETLTFIPGESEALALGYVNTLGNKVPLRFIAGGEDHLWEMSQDDLLGLVAGDVVPINISAGSKTATPVSPGVSDVGDVLDAAAGDVAAGADGTARVFRVGQIIPRLISTYDRQRDEAGDNATARENARRELQQSLEARGR